MEVTRGDRPDRQGSYVAYVPLSRAGGLTVCDRVLLTYVGGRWGYPASDQRFRGEILGYVGPLPGAVFRAPTEEDDA